MSGPSRRELLGGAAAGLLPLRWRRRRRRPNILVICADEHHPGLIGAYGGADVKTPHLDRLIGQGLSLERAYTAEPLCAPTRASMVTALWPQEHGQIGNFYALSPRWPTPIQALRDQGWITGAFGKLHLNETEHDFGFMDWNPKADAEQPPRPVRKRWMAGEEGFRVDPEDQALFKSTGDPRMWGLPIEDPLAHPDPWILQRSMAFIERHQREPWVAFTSFVLPHHWWTLPPEFYYLHDPDTLDLPPLGGDELASSAFGRLRRQRNGWAQVSEAARRLVRARYLGAIAWTDHHIGRLLAHLEALGLEEDTLVVYLSDHGEMGGDKGLWFKRIFFDAAARVPLVLRWPGRLPAGGRSGLLFNHVDLWPTLAGLVGCPLDMSRYTGQDLSDSLRGEVEGPRHTFSVIDAKVDGGQPLGLMVRDHRWKLCRYRLPDGVGRELYDMDADPEETRNLAEEEPAARDALEEAGLAFLDERRLCPFPPIKVEKRSLRLRDEAPED